MEKKQNIAADSMKRYRSPQAKVVEMNLQGILCQSSLTEGFGMSGNSYDEDDWE